MCEKCQKLLNVPVGKKAATVIKTWENPVVVGSTEMILDRYPNSIETFIHSQETDKRTGLWSNYCFDISHCPFCGEKLV